MEAKVTWSGQKMKFEAESRGFKVLQDAKGPFGEDSAPNPKEYVLQGLCGCTAMDTIALLKKFKQNVTALSVEVQTELTQGHPQVFNQINLVYKVTGIDLDESKVNEAVELSRHKYCGVIAMIEKGVPVVYSVEIFSQTYQKS